MNRAATGSAAAGSMAEVADTLSRAGRAIAGGSGRLPRLDSLTSLRFFAAFFVLQHHFSNFGGIPKLIRFTGFGTTGVSFFFVLSGVVLTWSFVPKDTARRFYIRRFARVWPLHVLTTFAAFPVFYTWRDVPPDWTGFILSIFLLHAWVPSASVYFAGNPASWSLSCEMFFYALHPFIARRVLVMRAAIVAALTVAALLALAIVADLAFDWPARLTGWLLYIGPIYRIGEFLVGVGIAVLLRRGVRLPLGGVFPPAIALGAWFWLFYITTPTWDPTIREVIAAADYAMLPLLYGLIIFAAAQDDLAGKRGWLRWRPFLLLGQWSYALYLVHAIVIYSFIELFGPRQFGYANIAWLLLVTVIATAIAAVLYYTVEQPLERRIRRAAEGAPAREPEAARELAPAQG